MSAAEARADAAGVADADAGPPIAEKAAFMAATAARTARTRKFWGCIPPGAGPRPIPAAGL